MANELTLDARLRFLPAATGNYDFLEVAALSVSPAAVVHLHTTILVGTAGTVFPLGSIATPCWFTAVNRDPANFVRVKTGSGGSDLAFAKLLPGWHCQLPLDPTDATAPAAFADTAACYVEYLVVSL